MVGSSVDSRLRGTMNESSNGQPIDIHLLTTDTLLLELMAGRKIACEGGYLFGLESEAARSALGWYQRNQGKWTGNLGAVDAEAIIDVVGAPVPRLAPRSVTALGHSARRLRLAKVVAHHFAGLHAHAAGSTERPDVFTFVPKKALTVFEGPNGSGKTSIMNAIVWCLTGYLIRSQREPEAGPQDVPCEVSHPDGTRSTHLMSAVTPMPHTGDGLVADGGPIAADTWVEVTFVDENGVTLPPLRREQKRKGGGKLIEGKPDLAATGLDPVAWRIAAIMPALLPFLPVGSTSQLGQAVAKLTGLSELVDLAKHASKAEERVSNRMRKELAASRSEIASRYAHAANDLKEAIAAYPDMVDSIPMPEMRDGDAGPRLQALSRHLAEKKAGALAEARKVLGAEFDPSLKESRDELEASIRPAIEQLRRITQLPSVARLAALTLDGDAVAAAMGMLARIRTEAATLAELAASPDRARRMQLYARVAAWMHDHGHHHDGICPICVGQLEEARDPVTGVAVVEHLADAARDRDVVARTVAEWSTHWVGQLLRDLPPSLVAEARRDLPGSPVDLLRTGLIDELFLTDGFRGALSALRPDAEELIDELAAQLPPFHEPAPLLLEPAFAAQADVLDVMLARMGRALAFADWRAANSEGLRGLLLSIRRGGDDALASDRALGRKLDALLAIVEGTVPLSSAAALVDRMGTALAEDDAKRLRSGACSRAAEALALLVPLGDLAEAQVEALRGKLHKRSEHWRRAVYRNATEFAPDLVDTSMSATGVLDFRMGRQNVSAPAQHVSNASALRGTLLGFLLAFREHVLSTRGGVELLLLDDPQDLLDGDNRDRLARGLASAAGTSAQLLVTTNDGRFARALVAENRGPDRVEHLSVHAVNTVRPTLRTAPSVEEVDRKRVAFIENRDDAGAARDYAAHMRVFLEARLGDLLDDAAHPAYAASTRAPTLETLMGRLRGLVTSKASELFLHPAVKRFAEDPRLADGAEPRRVLNASHHGQVTLTYMDVKAVEAELVHLRTTVEQMHEQFRLHRWREPLARVESSAGATATILPFRPPGFDVPIHPDLAAFAGQAPQGGSQEMPVERLDSGWFEGKSLYFLRRDTLGTAIRSGWVAVVETEPYEGRDGELVIARHGSQVLARQVVVGVGSGSVSLLAQASDPGARRPTLMLPRNGLRLHRIVGAIFSEMPTPEGKGEATRIDSVPELARVTTAFRVRQGSAVPVALPGQVVLGGPELTSAALSEWEGRFAAVSLMDGSSVFKRIGATLPGNMRHLRMFESIGAGGSSEVIATEEVPGNGDLPMMVSARLVVGVLHDVG